MQSNLIIYSNIYPWNGRWQHGDREFMSKIWDVAALRILDNLEKKKEVELTPYQREIFECVLPCPELPRGDNPWGHAKDGRRVCLCRKFRCSRFKECRGKNGVLSERDGTVEARVAWIDLMNYGKPIATGIKRKIVRAMSIWDAFMPLKNFMMCLK